MLPLPHTSIQLPPTSSFLQGHVCPCSPASSSSARAMFPGASEAGSRRCTPESCVTGILVWLGRAGHRALVSSFQGHCWPQPHCSWCVVTFPLSRVPLPWEPFGRQAPCLRGSDCPHLASALDGCVLLSDVQRGLGAESRRWVGRGFCAAVHPLCPQSASGGHALRASAPAPCSQPSSAPPPGHLPARP